MASTIQSDISSATEEGQVQSLNVDSDFDDGLAVPPSLSVIPTLKKENLELTDLSFTDGQQTSVSIPFVNVHSSPVKFKSVHRKVFIPGVEVKVKFSDYERSMTGHLLNPNLYTIKLSHGDFSWTIKKRYTQILKLHQELLVYRTGLNIPFPTKSHRERRQSFKVQNAEAAAEKAALDGNPDNQPRKVSNNPKKRFGALPRFPKKPEVLISYDDVPARMRQLEDYLYNLCNITIYRNHHELVDFFEVSHLSFVGDLGFKGKEGMIMKKTGSTRPGQTGCDCCGLLHYGLCNWCSSLFSMFTCGKWKNRWFFLKDTCLGYITPEDGRIKAVMLFDQGFEVSTGMHSMGLNHVLQILNFNRQMLIKVWTKRKAKDWKTQLNTILNTTAKDFTGANPHQSFVPMRMHTTASFFVDGAGYFSAVADCLEGAKEEIYITDWWLSPEIYLKRPSNGDYWRLDTILKRKAAQGVKVFILLYKEVELALGINSYYSKSRLNYDNIKVLRHPDHAKAGVFLWAHHEKIVCIDQSIAFIGGIDLCYGRWDDHVHRLVDQGDTSGDLKPANAKPSKKLTSSSPMATDLVCRLRSGNPEDVLLSNGETMCTENGEPDPVIENPGFASEETDMPLPAAPNMQPGDNLLQASTNKRRTSELVYLEDHYNPELRQKRNVIDKLTDKSKDFLHKLAGDNLKDDEPGSADWEKMKANRYAESNIFFPEDLPFIMNRSSMPPLAEDESTLGFHDSTVQKAISSMESSSKLWVGKDYANFIVKDLVSVDSPFVDIVDRSTTPRMPWHDIATMVEGAAARDAARHFIQRWNSHKLEKAKKNQLYPYLLPKSYTNITVPNLTPNLEKYNVTCQILRSISCWSGGFVDTETYEESIHDAYIETITRAQHYIYIENQFFITLSTKFHVKNQVGDALFGRIMRAHKAGDVFRVFVILPLLPAFEGEIGAPSGISLHAITHWNYQSISRGNESLIQRLKNAGIEDPSQYVTFHGLRNHAVLEGEPVTELVYVHSKLLIVDDKIVICGSANLNDRSLLGKRDSEVCVLMQDEVFEEGRMNGKIFPCGNFAGSLRKRLFREHLGLIEDQKLNRQVDITDPTIDSFYQKVWKTFSQDNTDVYEKVFHCLPTDSVKTFAELSKYKEDFPHSMWHHNQREANAEIKKIKGHLVNFPLFFLEDEILTPPNTSVEGFMPTSLWT